MTKEKLLELGFTLEKIGRKSNNDLKVILDKIKELKKE